MINLKNIAVLLFSLVVPGLAIAQTEVLNNGHLAIRSHKKHKICRYPILNKSRE